MFEMLIGKSSNEREGVKLAEFNRSEPSSILKDGFLYTFGSSHRESYVSTCTVIDLESLEIREIDLPVSHGRVTHAWMNGSECRVTKGWNNSIDPGYNESNEIYSYNLNGFSITLIRKELTSAISPMGTGDIITDTRTYLWQGIGYILRSNNSPINFSRIPTNIPNPGRYIRSFLYNGNHYIVGGAEDVVGASQIRKTIYRFNHSNETFTLLHTLRMEQAAHGVIVDGDWIYFFGGIAYSSVDNEIRNTTGDRVVKKTPPNMVVRFNMVTKVEEVVPGWDFLPISGYVKTFKIEGKLLYVHNEGIMMYDW